MAEQITRITPARWFRHALSIDDLLRLMEGRARALECARDCRAPFVRQRADGVNRVSEALQGAGFGEMSGWIERVEIEHVHQYLRNDDAWDRGDRSMTAAPWQAVFSHARKHARPEQVHEAASLVHLMYDLPLALVPIGFGSSFGKAALAFDALTAIYADSTSSYGPLSRQQVTTSPTAFRYAPRWW